MMLLNLSAHSTLDTRRVDGCVILPDLIRVCITLFLTVHIPLSSRKGEMNGTVYICVLQYTVDTLWVSPCVNPGPIWPHIVFYHSEYIPLSQMSLRLGPSVESTQSFEFTHMWFSDVSDRILSPITLYIHPFVTLLPAFSSWETPQSNLSGSLRQEVTLGSQPLTLPLLLAGQWPRIPFPVYQWDRIPLCSHCDSAEVTRQGVTDIRKMIRTLTHADTYSCMHTHTHSDTVTPEGFLAPEQKYDISLDVKLFSNIQGVQESYCFQLFVFLGGGIGRGMWVGGGVGGYQAKNRTGGPSFLWDNSRDQGVYIHM